MSDPWLGGHYRCELVPVLGGKTFFIGEKSADETALGYKSVA